jgi:hypothetical protein
MTVPSGEALDNVLQLAIAELSGEQEAVRHGKS